MNLVEVQDCSVLAKLNSMLKDMDYLPYLLTGTDTSTGMKGEGGREGERGRRGGERRSNVMCRSECGVIDSSGSVSELEANHCSRSLPYPWLYLWISFCSLLLPPLISLLLSSSRIVFDIINIYVLRRLCCVQALLHHFQRRGSLQAPQCIILTLFLPLSPLPLSPLPLPSPLSPPLSSSLLF